MSTRLTQMLKTWQSQPDLDWVLATLISVEGSSYRKPGAMMLINSIGQYFGLISGGCLESDVIHHARKVMDDHCSRTITYDMTDEDDLSWQLGIGCGGKISILLQSINQANHYLQLPLLLESMESQQAVYYVQHIDNKLSVSDLYNVEEGDNVECISHLSNADVGLSAQAFYQLIKPNPHIAIFGGGIDAQPLVNLASELGWKISLADPRSAYARERFFSNADNIAKLPIAELINEPWLSKIDIAIVMHHNVKLDAQALKLLKNTNVQYIGLLGPDHRTVRVFDELDFTQQQFDKTLANPVGLNLGGDMPETIALSILSEAQAFLAKRDARSFSLNLDSQKSTLKSATSGSL